MCSEVVRTGRRHRDTSSRNWHKANHTVALNGPGMYVPLPKPSLHRPRPLDGDRLIRGSLPMKLRLAVAVLALVTPIALAAQEHDRSPRTHDSSPSYHDSSPRPTGQQSSTSHR
jgi:hypothetical protein